MDYQSQEFYDSLPDCCKNCLFFESEFSDWTYSMHYWCELNIWFPTRKKSCKKQKPRR